MGTTAFYIARVHGRFEIPETIVLTDDDYSKLQEDVSYQEFIVHIFKTYKCLFLGFSFLDPAIEKIFKLIDRTIAQPYPNLHMAIIPSDANPGLTSKLSNFNIQVVKYDASKNHDILWNAVKTAQRSLRTNERIAPDKLATIEGLHRFLSSCYARMKLGKQAEPLREVVVQGIIAQTIADSGADGINKNDLLGHIKKYISLDSTQLSTLIENSIESLMEQKLCGVSDGKLTCIVGDEKPYDKVIEELVDGVSNRMKVRHGVSSNNQIKAAIATVLNRIFLTRGWDLGAHFAGGNPFNTFDDRLQVQTLLEKYSKNLSPDLFKTIANSILNLFKSPDTKESALLVDVGRIAFGVELVLNNARSTTEQKIILPDILYLDASVLLPIIVDGHPFRTIYRDAIERLQTVGKKSGERIDMRTCSMFLEEIIHHRRSSIQEVNELKLENKNNLRNQINFYGAENTNVFIGAYASWVGRSNDPIAYSKFLQEAAPYNTEKDLEKYLQTMGVGNLDLNLSKFETHYNAIRTELHSAYSDYENSSIIYRKKANILIDHEALQLTQLSLDIKNGQKPLFVTADKRLMSLLNRGSLEGLEKHLVSHLGLIQLIDLVIGLGDNPDKRALARLMWSVEYSEEETSIMNYLIDLALRYVDEAKTMAMWEVVDEIVQNASKEAEDEGISLSLKYGSQQDRARLAKFLDRFEDDFFAKMNEVIIKWEKQDAK